MFSCHSLQHTALVVTDLARSKTFYEHVLGLSPLERPAFDFPGLWYAIGPQQLHLLVHPRGLTVRHTTKIDSRDGHFAIRINDYDAAIEHFRNLGVEYDARPQSITGWKQIFVSDPDGNIIELNAQM